MCHGARSGALRAPELAEQSVCHGFPMVLDAVIICLRPLIICLRPYSHLPLLEPSWTPLGPLGALLEPSWSPLGAVLSPLGVLWSPLEALLEPS